MFSVLEGYLRRHQALDRNGILAGVLDGFRPNWADHDVAPVVGNWDRAAEKSGWLKPYIKDMVGVTKFRQFEVEINGESKIAMLRARCETIDHPGNQWSDLDGNIGFFSQAC